VASEADVAHLARLPGFHSRLHGAARGEDALGVVHANDFVELQHINVIGLEPLERLIDLVGGSLGVAAVDLRHQECLLPIAVAQGLSHADLAVTIVVVPAVVEEVHAMVERGAHDADGFGLTGPTEMVPANAQDRNLLASMPQGTAGKSGARVRR
jgi:hypothetical protein